MGAKVNAWRTSCLACIWNDTCAHRHKHASPSVRCEDASGTLRRGRTPPNIRTPSRRGCHGRQSPTRPRAVASCGGVCSVVGSASAPPLGDHAACMGVQARSPHASSSSAMKAAFCSAASPASLASSIASSLIPASRALLRLRSAHCERATDTAQMSTQDRRCPGGRGDWFAQLFDGELFKHRALVFCDPPAKHRKQLIVCRVPANITNSAPEQTKNDRNWSGISVT